jgi:hypothetical protein
LVDLHEGYSARRIRFAYMCSAPQGTLPASYSQLTQLELVLFDSRPDVTGLNGQLPNWAGSLKYGILVSFDNNNFSGPIPQAWCSTGALTLSIALPLDRA